MPGSFYPPAVINQRLRESQQLRLRLASSLKVQIGLLKGLPAKEKIDAELVVLEASLEALQP